MNARALREMLAGSALTLSLLPGALAPALWPAPLWAADPDPAQPDAAAGPKARTGTKAKGGGSAAQTRTGERTDERTASAKTLARDLAAKNSQARAARMAPRKLAVNLPRQESFETGAVQQADITPDGKWLALTRLSGGYSELWLRPLALVSGKADALPRRLAPALADRLSPALSPDGKLLAFVGLEDDVKGDIYLLDLTKPDAAPVKLTSRDTEDGAPVFAPDGRTLYFHQRLPGEETRRIVAQNIKGAAADGPARIVPTGGDAGINNTRGDADINNTGGDAAQPTLSPDGKLLAFVSTRGGAPAVYVMNLTADAAAGHPRKLTNGSAAESSPRFGLGDGGAHTVYFVLAPADRSAGALKPIIASADADAPGGPARPLTSARGADAEPLVAGTGTAARLYFLTAQNGPVNLWSLPLEGEIPTRPAAELKTLADTLAAQLPVDRHLTILAYSRAAAAANGDAPAKTTVAEADYAMGRQYESLGLRDEALAAHRAAVATGVEPQAGFSRIRSILLEETAARRQAVNDAGRAKALNDALAALAAIRSTNDAVPRQAVLERARLLMDQAEIQGGGAAIMLAASIRTLSIWAVRASTRPGEPCAMRWTCP